MTQATLVYKNITMVILYFFQKLLYKRKEEGISYSDIFYSDKFNNGNNGNDGNEGNICIFIHIYQTAKAKHRHLPIYYKFGEM